MQNYTSFMTYRGFDLLIHSLFTAGHQGGRLLAHEELNTPRGETALWCAEQGQQAGRETRRGVCRLGDPSGCFQWAEDLKGHFLAEGRPWLSKVPMGDWCFCKPQSCRELLEETARLEERLQPEKILAGGSGSYIFIFNKFASASRSAFSVGKIHLIPFSIFCVLINYCMRV